MGKKIEMIGNRYGRLVVIERAPSQHGHAMWICKCDCGSVTHPIGGSDLRGGEVQSCGCLHKEFLAKARTSHGMKGTRLYRIWQNMKNRCQTPSVPCYETYGGRGITVCEEWQHDFLPFHSWAMANGYADDLTLDRKDSNGNYCPENCRWVSRKAQANNFRKNVILEINGEKHTIAEWADISGIKYTTIYQRRLRGWTDDDLLKPV